MNDRKNGTTIFFMFIDCRVKRRKEKRRKEAKLKRKKEIHWNSCRCSFFPSFSLSPSVGEEISQVKLRKQFPFLWRDPIEGRAKRSVKNQLVPQLLNSYQGHNKSITGLIFSQLNQVLISSSIDKSVRLWSLSGQVLIF